MVNVFNQFVTKLTPTFKMRFLTDFKNHNYFFTENINMSISDEETKLPDTDDYNDEGKEG